jgi:ATP/ADP translocase
MLETIFYLLFGVGVAVLSMQNALDKTPEKFVDDTPGPMVLCFFFVTFFWPIFIAVTLTYGWANLRLKAAKKKVKEGKDNSGPQS